MAQFFLTILPFTMGLPVAYKFQTTVGCPLDAVWWFRRLKVIVNPAQLFFGVSVSVETALRCFGIFPDYLRRGQLLIPSLLHMQYVAMALPFLSILRKHTLSKAVIFAFPIQQGKEEITTQLGQNEGRQKRRSGPMVLARNTFYASSMMLQSSAEKNRSTQAEAILNYFAPMGNLATKRWMRCHTFWYVGKYPLSGDNKPHIPCITLLGKPRAWKKCICFVTEDKTWTQH